MFDFYGLKPRKVDVRRIYSFNVITILVITLLLMISPAIGCDPMMESCRDIRGNKDQVWLWIYLFCFPSIWFYLYAKEPSGSDPSFGYIVVSFVLSCLVWIVSSIISMYTVGIEFPYSAWISVFTSLLFYWFMLKWPLAMNMNEKAISLMDDIVFWVKLVMLISVFAVFIYSGGSDEPYPRY